MSDLFFKTIQQACLCLKQGGVILYPTDTVWGLGCDATNENAVQQIFKIKQRALSKSMITLVKDTQMAKSYLSTPPKNLNELLENTPTPQTVILKNPQLLAPSLITQEKTCAFRAPQHLFCQELLTTYQKPIVSTSANISQQPTPFYFKDIQETIKQQADFVVDPALEGLSTHKPSRIVLVDEKGIHILRE